MTVSILSVLGTLPSGERGVPLDFSELGAYLLRWCKTDEEKVRNARHALRDELYKDGGVAKILEVIADIFVDKEIIERRQKFAKYARFNNALKRVVNELSTVYTDPAIRTVEGDENNAAYQAVLEAISMDEHMLQVNRLFNLHRALLVRPRVRVRPDGDREPVIDIATPAIVRAVLHPLDSTQVIGWLIRFYQRAGRGASAQRVPEWELWTDHEVVQLDGDMQPIPSTYRLHGIGVNPWVSITRHPALPGFWPGEEGEDLVAAHISIWLTNTFMLKETKSATKVPLVSGDTQSMARGQALDADGAIEAPDGVAVTTIDTSMDLSMFRDTAGNILETVANNYGMSAALVKHQGVQSAEARELMRVPIRELRKEQHVPFRRFERRFAVVTAAVLKADLPDMAFEPEGWGCDFGESQTPLTPTESLNLFEKSRTMGVANTVDYLMGLNPDLTEAQAWAYVERCIEIETKRNVLMRPLQRTSGSMGAANEPPPPPKGSPPPPGQQGNDQQQEAA